MSLPPFKNTVDHFDRTLVNMLTVYCQTDKRKWDEFLSQVMVEYRAASLYSIGVSLNKKYWVKMCKLEDPYFVPKKIDDVICFVKRSHKQ